MGNYPTVVREIQNNLIRQGADKETVSEAFGNGQNEKLNYIKELYNTYSKYSQLYKEEDLQNLKNITTPHGILEFYENFEPKNLPILAGGITLLDLESIKNENSSAAPGMYLIKYGVIVFATTVGGHAICMDLNDIHNDEPCILICDYTFCSFNDDLAGVEVVNLPEDIANNYAPDEPIMLSYELIKKCLPEISKTFSGFIEGIANEIFSDIEKEYLF